MTKFLLIDYQKNSVEIDLAELSPEDQKIIWSLIHTDKAKRNKNKRDLHNEINNWLQSVKPIKK